MSVTLHRRGQKNREPEKARNKTQKGVEGHSETMSTKKDVGHNSLRKRTKQPDNDTTGEKQKNKREKKKDRKKENEKKKGTWGAKKKKGG